MAFPLTRAARALADEYRPQAAQIQTLADSNDSNVFITALGCADSTNYRFEFPRAPLPVHEHVMSSLLTAKSTLHELADLLDLWANDTESLKWSTRQPLGTREIRVARIHIKLVPWPSLLSLSQRSQANRYVASPALLLACFWYDN